MSQENVDRLRRAFEAWSRGDRQTVEALLRDSLAPGFEMHPLYLDEVYRGAEGMWAMWAAASALWEDYRFELEEIVDLDNHALVMGRILGRGAASGVPISQPLAMLVTFRDDKAVRAKSFTSKHEALEAAELSEQAMSRRNVEIVRELIAEFAKTHRAVAGLTTPESVWDMGTFRGWPEVPEYVGPDGFDEFFGKWTDPYEDWDMDLDDLRDAGDDRVLAIVTQRGRLRGTDDWVELRFGLIFTLTAGLVSHTEAFATGAEAIEAAGLRE